MMRAALLGTLMFFAAGWGRAAAVRFAPRELFRIPFGKSPEALGTRIDGGSFLFPRDFTMDEAGHFYISDTQNHRIARYSSAGKFEMAFRYPPTAGQVFAHADERGNLWLLISDPARGVYDGVYSPTGQLLKAGIFSRFHHFRLHLDDDYGLHVILSGDADRPAPQMYILDKESLLMKKEKVAPPPEGHHELRRKDQVYFIDPVPTASRDDSRRVNRITDAAHHGVASIRGVVAYVTDRGEIYARVGDRELDVYDAAGAFEGKVLLKGLRSACRSVRFDAEGNIYELDGIADRTDDDIRRLEPGRRDDFEDLHYSARMPGMRLIEWERR